MRNKSFTLIELLVVIAIIGLLASIVIVNLTGTRSKANIARGLQFSQSIHHALGAYAVGVWSFDEGSGTTAYDASGYGNNGTINGASHTTDTPSGQGYALSFDGVDDYVDCGNLGSFFDYGTIEFWMNTFRLRNWDNPFTTKFQGLNAGIRFELNESGMFSVYIGDDAADYTFHMYLNSGLTINTWWHVVLVWDSVNNNVKGYLNSVKKFDNSHTKWATTLPQIAIGNGFSSSRYFNGLIDDVRIYEKALEIAQIEAMYYAGLDSLLARGLIDQEEYQKRLVLGQ